MTAAEDIAAWALGLRLDDVAPEASAAACRHLLDGTGTAIAAARAGEVPAARAVARAFTGEATVIGSGERLAAPAAALANGALVHALDFDDTHAAALVHATATVLPAAFAVGEETGASGADVLTAAIAGYEVVSRLGAAIPHGFHARGFHATSVCGVFAAALVSARLAGLGPREAVDALGIAGSMASGSLEFLSTGASTKQLHPGLSGMAGILAARLAAGGADGPATIFEGEYGLYRAFTGRAIDPAMLSSGLGATWEVTRITVKLYPACQLSHASLDALRGLLPKLSEPIDAIVFDVPESTVPIVCEPAAGKRAPRTAYEGKFSLPFCAAALLLDGSLGVGSFEPEGLRRSDVLELAARVGHRPVAFAGPPAEAPGAVEVRMRSGGTLRNEVPGSRGGPDDPLSDEELLAKFAANGGSDALARALLDLADQPSVGRILEATVWPS